MQSYRKPLLAAVVILAAIFTVSAFKEPKKRKQVITQAQTKSSTKQTPPLQTQTPPTEKEKEKETLPKPATDQKIQVAILLDVSNSMDGLIDQAKAQLWTMVNTLGRVHCDNKANPKIEIALYEYGSPRNDERNGYIKQINNFITDLDSLSENLFALTTDGGDEFCGHVIFKSVQQLKWDPNPNSYKVVFIAGNESFRQGSVSFSQACTEAKSKGVIVNTIYCGDRQQGIREYWNLVGECGNGSFSNINQDHKIEDIATPYDDEIFKLNEKLNSTYITYGARGQEFYSKQEKMDVANSAMSKKAAIKRAETKSNSKVYNNAGWDLVDRAADNEAEIEKIDKKTLPDSLQNKTTAQLKVIVSEKKKERAAIQTKIISLNQQRQNFINDQKTKDATTVVTLETEVERIIKEQVKRFKMNVQ
ncbi:vWA domain-containing protein [Lacibacter sediminis]|uniref:VWA domain-containing protein n=1 Tax=Lacibacter sediminis TaxID=2760713 RepID=A0A7G5XFB2_9BACT|nr:vWA domain-containing protein [Lacibacter sediminis]QNA44165.1 VWA domain-containing protein [Lacibacter sediminis]